MARVVAGSGVLSRHMFTIPVGSFASFLLAELAHHPLVVLEEGVQCRMGGRRCYSTQIPWF